MNVIMSQGDVITRSTKFFCKGKINNRGKTFFSWNKSSTYYVYMRKSKKITKDKKTSNHRFLLMLGEFKSDQLFVEKTKLANNLFVENLNHLSWQKSPTNYVQQEISKITKENNCFKF